MNLKELKIKNKKQIFLFLLLGLIILIIGITVLFINFRPDKTIQETQKQQYPIVKFIDGQILTENEQRIVNQVLELQRSPLADFVINVQGIVKELYNQNMILGIGEDERLKVSIAMDAMIVREVFPEPQDLLQEITLEPFPLENIMTGDMVRIQARINTLGDLEAYEIIVIPMGR